MTLDEFEALAVAEWERLPAGMRAWTEGVQLIVADDPSADALEALGLQHPDELLGLFEGHGLGDAGWAPPTATFPNRISLFRRPILAFSATRGDTIPAVVQHVLVHEIGHHFGLSDADMAAIDGEDYA